MQDIVFKKTRTVAPTLTPVIIPAVDSDLARTQVRELQTLTLQPTLGTFVLEVGKRASLALDRLLPARAYAIRQLARHAPKPANLPTPTTASLLRLPLPKQFPTLPVAEVRKHMSTPLGKVSLIQGVAFIALFAFVVASRQSGQPVSPRNVGTATQNVFRQYLPTAANYATPQPFNSTALADEANDVSTQVWATPWNLTDIAPNVSQYSSVSAFWLTVNPDGETFTPKADWSTWNAFATANKQPGQTYYLTVSGNPNYTYLALTEPKVEAQHIATLLQLVQQNNFDGIDIDYEGLGRENRDVFTAFVKQLTTSFHANHKLVAVTVEASVDDSVPMDWYAIGQVADQLRVMVYDYHAATTGAPGPIAPIGWLQEILDYAQKSVSSDKLVIGLGNYGYDWTAPTTPGASWQGTGVSYDQATALAKQYDKTINRQSGVDARGYDIGSVPEFTYVDSSGAQHDVWFEDKESLQAQVNLAEQYQPAGIIFWTADLADDAPNVQQ
jgi:spore germination protein YaaH